MPKVSFIVPCFEQWNWLPEALASIKTQTFTDYEIILVCETPSNSPRDVNQVDKIIWHRENIGLAQARNSGLRLSEAEYVVPLDADDTIEPSFLEKTLTVVEAVSTDIVIPNTHAPLSDAIYKNNYLPYCSLYHRALLQSVGGWEPHPIAQGMEDWDLWIRLRKEYGFGEPLVKSIPDHLFNWRRHPGSMSSQFEGKPLYGEIKRALMQKYGLPCE